MKIKDGQKYLIKLVKVLRDHNMIENPKDFKKILPKSKIQVNKEGDIVGWQITSKKVNFITGDYLDVDEYAEFMWDEDQFIINKGSYHFQPSSNRLHFFRIDKNYSDIHANPCNTFELEDHLYPENLKLKIKLFNLLISIYVALKYINNSDKYPLLDRHADMYNSVIEGGKC